MLHHLRRLCVSLRSKTKPPVFQGYAPRMVKMMNAFPIPYEHQPRFPLMRSAPGQRREGEGQNSVRALYSTAREMMTARNNIKIAEAQRNLLTMDLRTVSPDRPSWTSRAG